MKSDQAGHAAYSLGETSTSVVKRLRLVQRTYSGVRGRGIGRRLRMRGPGPHTLEAANTLVIVMLEVSDTRRIFLPGNIQHNAIHCGVRLARIPQIMPVEQ